MSTQRTRHVSAHAAAHGTRPAAGLGQPSGTSTACMVGLIIFLASEIMLFGSFFTAFFYVRYQNYTVYPPEPFDMPVDSTAHQHGDPDRSSFTMHWALVVDQARQPPGPRRSGLAVHADPAA